MFKKILLDKNESLAQNEYVQKNWSFGYVFTGLIVCSMLAIGYVVFQESITLSKGKSSSSDEISTLSLTNSVNTTGTALRKTLVEEISGQYLTLDLTLTGVIFNQSNGGIALISLSGNPAQPYVLGAYIKPGYMIQTIAPERVMLAEGPDKPVIFTLLLMTKSEVSFQSNNLITSSVSSANSAVAYHSDVMHIPKILESGPVARTDVRYRIGSTVRHQHAHVEVVP